jgi:hypothetical protein
MADSYDATETTLPAFLIQNEIEEVLLCCAREIIPEPEMEIRGFGPKSVVIEPPLETLVVRDGKLVDVRTGIPAPSSTPVKIPQRKSRYETSERRSSSIVYDILFGD